MVVSLNSTHGAAAGTDEERQGNVFALAAPYANGRTGPLPTLVALEAALAEMPISSFTVLSDQETRVPLPSRCAAHRTDWYDKYTTFVYQFDKLRTCYHHVVQYERDQGVCFDFLVMSRPDDIWLSKVPHVSTLPRDTLTVPKHWPGMVGIPHMVEDHFFVIPRRLAPVFAGAVNGWSRCLPLETIGNNCPFPYRGYQNQTRVMQSECILGHYLHSQNVSWQHHEGYIYSRTGKRALRNRTGRT